MPSVLTNATSYNQVVNEADDMSDPEQRDDRLWIFDGIDDFVRPLVCLCLSLESGNTSAVVRALFSLAAS